MRLSRLFKKKNVMTIKLEGLTEPQKLAVEDMMRAWVLLGNLGSSRWTCFYADGDGDFRPKITVDGRKPEFCDLIDEETRWMDKDHKIQHHSGDYMIDFDSIAWKIREERKVGF
jgi:hypothetical protein